MRTFNLYFLPNTALYFSTTHYVYPAQEIWITCVYFSHAFVGKWKKMHLHWVIDFDLDVISWYWMWSDVNVVVLGFGVFTRCLGQYPARMWRASTHTHTATLYGRYNFVSLIKFSQNNPSLFNLTRLKWIVD